MTQQTAGDTRVKHGRHPPGAGLAQVETVFLPEGLRRARALRVGEVTPMTRDVRGVISLHEIALTRNYADTRAENCLLTLRHKPVTIR